MPTPPRAQRAKSAATPAVIRTEDFEPKMDGMDFVLAGVWAIGIPIAVYVLLSLAGMPPGGGKSSGSWQEQMERGDEIKAVKAPVTFREIDMRLSHVDRLLQDHVPLYLQRTKVEDNQVKNFWQELAFRVLGICKNELVQIQASIQGSEEMRARPELGQRVRQRIAHIEEQEIEIVRASPFPDRLRNLRPDPAPTPDPAPAPAPAAKP